MALAGRHGLAVVEDCAQSHGAALDGRALGSFGHAAAYSFYPTKNLGCVGDGGAVLTNDAALAAKLRRLNNYGFAGNSRVSHSLGCNSRLDEIQAAIFWRCCRIWCPAMHGTPIVCAEDLTSELLALPLLVPLFTPGHRHTAAREAARLGLSNPFRLIDPSVAAPRRLDLGASSYVNAGCSLGSGSSFGEFVLVNRGASIGHHVHLGAFVSVGPGAVIAGHVTVGTGSMVGAGATILPCTTVGDNAVVAAGAAVTRDVPDGCLVAGHPARIARRGAAGYKGLTVSR